VSNHYSLPLKTKETLPTPKTTIWSFAQRVNKDVSSNLNALELVSVPIDGPLTTNHTGFAINGNGIQLLGPNTHVRISANVFVVSTANRVNLTLRLHSSVGGLFGPIAAHGYISNNNDHQNSSYTIPGFWKSMVTGETITLQALQEANSGTITMALEGTSFLLLETLKNV